MNKLPHLLREDHQEYERILDEALRSAPHSPELAAVGNRLNPEQLRTMALNATALITAAAAPEYQYYVRVREELRDPASPSPLYEPSGRVYSSTGSASASTPSAFPRSRTRPAAADHHAPAGLGRRLGAAVLGAGQPGGRGISDGVAAQRWARMSYGRRLLAAVLGLHVRPEVPKAAGTAEARTPTGETTEAAGSGAFAGLAAPAAVLSGTVAAILLLVGLVLRMFSAESTSAPTMITAGSLFGAVTGVIVVCAVVTALRSRGRSTRQAEDYREEFIEDVARAREVWREAVLERGILPFLRAALGDPGTAALNPTAPSAPANRMPRVGYVGPDFTDPAAGTTGPRPSFRSPDYTSPDFGGPEHQPE